MSEQQEKFQKIAKIDEVEGVLGAKPTSENLDKLSALSKAKFDAALEQAENRVDYYASVRQQAKVAASEELQVPKGPSPIDAVRMDRKVTRAEPTPENLVAQAEALQSDFAKVKDSLAQAPDVQLNKTQQSLLSEKLVHVDTTLKAALSTAGAELKIEPSDIATLKQNPVFKFMSYLTQGEGRLQEITAQIQRLSYTNGNLSPEKLLAVQLKLGFVQQELEFFTNVVNKALESTKTIMNVQV